MDYERIDKSHQLGGFSPTKLRAMLLGVEKQRKEEEELESRLRSDAAAAAADEAPAVSSPAFEFPRSERAGYKPALLIPFSKPTPSKWDDAEKWISSPTSNRGGRGGGGQVKKSGLIGFGGRGLAQKVTDELGGKRMEPPPPPGVAKREVAAQEAGDWLPDQYPIDDSGDKPLAENPDADSAGSLSRHDSSNTVQNVITFTNTSTSKSVSMRDMGTEMTPTASQEPSRTGTPVRETTPTQSANSSRSPTPQRNIQSSATVESCDFHDDLEKKELSEKQLQADVRRDIMVLGTKLGKSNITAWANKEHDANTSTSPKTIPVGHQSKSIPKDHAAVWEEAEKARYLARFKREEIEIQSWENHQKAKAEAEMMKTETGVERLKARSQERLLKKLAGATQKAEKKRAAAEARRNQQAKKTERQVEYIKRTGRIPSSFSYWGWLS